MNFFCHVCDEQQRFCSPGLWRLTGTLAGLDWDTQPGFNSDFLALLEQSACPGGSAFQLHCFSLFMHLKLGTPSSLFPVRPAALTGFRWAASLS